MLIVKTWATTTTIHESDLEIDLVFQFQSHLAYFKACMLRWFNNMNSIPHGCYITVPQVSISSLCILQVQIPYDPIGNQLQ